MLGVLDYHYHIFDAEAELVVLVEPRLVRDTHPFFELKSFVSLDPESFGTLVNIEHAADTVACSVCIVFPDFKQVSPRQKVKILTSKLPALGPNCPLEVDDPHENPRVSFFLKWCDSLSWTEMYSAANVCSAI